MGELSVMLTLSLLYGGILDPKTGQDQKGHHWSYVGDDGPQHWPDHFPRCSGQRQSPVDIRTGEVEYASWLTELEFLGYEKYLGHGLSQPVTIKNNGHTASMAVTQDLMLRGSHLIGDYQLAEMHLHWGSNNSVGSEHCIDGKKKAAEIHFVHYAKKYGNLSEAMKMPDGLAVIGVFVELVPDDTYAFDRLAYGIDNILEYGSKTNITNIRMQDFLPRNTQEFYHYRGSLTTPPCYESVLWFVMRDNVYISERQLTRFRYLQEKVHEHVAATGRANSVSSRVFKSDPVYIRDNFRPLQPLWGRKVYCSSMVLSKPQLRDFELPAVKITPVKKFNSMPLPANRIEANPTNSGTDYIFRGLSRNSYNPPPSGSINGVISNGNNLLIGNISPGDIKGAVFQHLNPDHKYSEPSSPVNQINRGNNDRLHVFRSPDTAAVLSNGLNSGKSAPLLDYIFTQMHGLTRSNSGNNQRRYNLNDYPALSQPKDRILASLSDLLANPATSRVLSNPFIENGIAQAEAGYQVNEQPQQQHQNYNNNNNNNNNHMTIQSTYQNQANNFHQGHNNYRSNNNANYSPNNVYNSQSNNNVRPSLASYHSSPQTYQNSGYLGPTLFPDYQQSRNSNSLTIFG